MVRITAPVFIFRLLVFDLILLSSTKILHPLNYFNSLNNCHDIAKVMAELFLRGHSASQHTCQPGLLTALITLLPGYCQNLLKELSPGLTIPQWQDIFPKRQNNSCYNKQNHDSGRRNLGVIDQQLRNHADYATCYECLNYIGHFSPPLYIPRDILPSLDIFQAHSMSYTGYAVALLNPCGTQKSPCGYK